MLLTLILPAAHLPLARSQAFATATEPTHRSQ
jgi:hypothetical protein